MHARARRMLVWRRVGGLLGPRWAVGATATAALVPVLTPSPSGIPQAVFAKAILEPVYELRTGVVALKTENSSGALCKIEFFMSDTDAGGGEFAAPHVQLPENWTLYKVEHLSGGSTWVAAMASASIPVGDPQRNIGTSHLPAVRAILFPC